MAQGVKINQFVCGVPGEGTHFLENLLNNTTQLGLKDQKTNEYQSVCDQKKIQKLNSDRILLLWLKEHFKKTNQLPSLEQIPPEVLNHVNRCAELELTANSEIPRVIAHNLPFYTVAQQRIHTIRTLWHIEPNPQTVWMSHVLAWIKNQWTTINEHTMMDLINSTANVDLPQPMAFPQLQQVQAVFDSMGNLHDRQSYVVYHCAVVHSSKAQSPTKHTVQEYLDREFWQGHGLKYRGTQLIRDYLKKYPELLHDIHSCTHQFYTMDYAQWCLDLDPGDATPLTQQQLRETQAYTEKNLEILDSFSGYTLPTTHEWIQNRVAEFRKRLHRARSVCWQGE